jgi:hypothetical protein
VRYLGRLDYSVLFPSAVAGIVAHLICGVTPPISVLHESFGTLTQPQLIFLSMRQRRKCPGTTPALRE